MLCWVWKIDNTGLGLGGHRTTYWVWEVARCFCGLAGRQTLYGAFGRSPDLVCGLRGRQTLYGTFWRSPDTLCGLRGCQTLFWVWEVARHCSGFFGGHQTLFVWFGSRHTLYVCLLLLRFVVCEAARHCLWFGRPPDTMWFERPPDTVYGLGGRQTLPGVWEGCQTVSVLWEVARRCMGVEGDQTQFSV